MKKVAIVLTLASIIPFFSFADDEKQDIQRAARVLKKLESHVATVSTKALMQMFYTDVNSDTINPEGSMYFVMREGNKLLKQELAKRVQKDKAVLKKHVNDNRTLFTGYNGPRETVGLICSRLLKTENP